MKRLPALWMLLCMVWTLPVRADVTIESITLTNTQNPVYVWTTAPSTTEWILGVSDQPSGPLLNAADSSITHLPMGRYWLFADPALLGRLPMLSVQLSDGRTLTTVFRTRGSNGTARAWRRVSGSKEMSLGWAQGVIDLVGTTDGTLPDGVDDLYMQATIGEPPAADPAAED